MKKAWLMLLLIAPAAAHDLGVGLDPAAEMGLFPAFSEVQSTLNEVEALPFVNLRTVGQTESGDAIRIAEIIIGDMPIADRAVTFIMTQQHGNEPAGTPALLSILRELESGAWDDVLENQVLLVLPMANPDGSDAGTRGNQDGTDINRDHIGLETGEGIAIHEVLNIWDVHVAVDHHEYSGTGLGYPVPVRIYDFDLTTMFPNHGNVRAPTRAMAEDLIYNGVWPYMQSQGYSTGDYGVQTINGIPVQQTAGGPDPGILRNAFGLNNIAGFLAESLVNAVETPLHDAVRREAIHLETMRATLTYVHENADAFIDAKRASERLNLDEPMDVYVEAEATPLATAYKGDNWDPLMALHGLPMGFEQNGEWTYNVVNERQGLLAAMLSPDSSRNVGPFVVAESVSMVSPVDHGDHEETPLPVALSLLAIAVALILRRN